MHGAWNNTAAAYCQGADGAWNVDGGWTWAMQHTECSWTGTDTARAEEERATAEEQSEQAEETNSVERDAGAGSAAVGDRAGGAASRGRKPL